MPVEGFDPGASRSPTLVSKYPVVVVRTPFGRGMRTGLGIFTIPTASARMTFRS